MLSQERADSLTTMPERTVKKKQDGLAGKSNPQLRIADRTRSRLSCMAVSGSPTMVKVGALTR